MGTIASTRSRSHSLTASCWTRSTPTSLTRRSTEDIGALAALAFDRPKEFIGLELQIVRSELTNLQATKVFSRVLGRPVKFQKLPMPTVRLLLGKEFYQMFRWFNAEGFKANITELRRRYPEVRLQTLEEWLRAEGWHKRARRVVPPQG